MLKEMKFKNNQNGSIVSSITNLNQFVAIIEDGDDKSVRTLSLSGGFAEPAETFDEIVKKFSTTPHIIILSQPSIEGCAPARVIIPISSIADVCESDGDTLIYTTGSLQQCFSTTMSFEELRAMIEGIQDESIYESI